jgi:hypothetical protein
LGRADLALKRADETVALARAMRQPITLVFTMLLAENLHALRREPKETIELGDEMIALCREYVLAQEIEWGRCFRAIGLSELCRARKPWNSCATAHLPRGAGAGLLIDVSRPPAEACFKTGRLLRAWL